MSNQVLLQKIIKLSSDPNLIEKAFKFAEHAHLGQKRLSKKDYITHPLGVAKILAKLELDPKTIAAALLHDVPDDTLISLHDIEKNFGEEISFLVSGVSKLGKLRYPKNNIDIKTIKERNKGPIDLRTENLRKMFFAMAQDIRVILIKLADRLDNMKTLNYHSREKQKRIAMETLEIFAPIANRLGIGEIRGGLEDLSFPYLYPKEHSWLIKNIKERYELREKYLEKLKPFIYKILKKEKIKVIDIHSRPKHYWSLYQKLLKHGVNFDRIYDLVALRIIIASADADKGSVAQKDGQKKDISEIKACYEALGIIHKFFKPLLGRIKDYIAFPRPNGYQAIHTTCFCLDGKITEIQIKTKEMHERAEYGIAAHWAYKEGMGSSSLKKKFAWVQQLRDWQKKIETPKEFLESLKIDFFKNRIFVFTPKGDVIDLPEGACPIDFAYAIHTDIGNQCSGAKINEKIAPLSQSLQNGDIVRIVTDKNRKPSRNWLEIVKTGMAQSRIKDWFKRESHPENLKRGIKLLNETFQQSQKTSWLNISQTKKDELLKIFSYKNLESLVAAVGRGKLSSLEILKTLFKEKDILFSAPAKALPRIDKKQTIALAGETGILMNIAKCCLPQPNEKIKAYVTKNRGATIHKIDCKNLKNLQEKWPQKIIKASWLSEKKLSYIVGLKIKAKDRIGLIKDLLFVVSELKINILNCQAESQTITKIAIINIKIEISGYEELGKLFSRLKQVMGIMEVKKVF